MDYLTLQVLDENEKRSNADLNTVVIEWFLKKYGVKDIAELMLKDFLLSIKKYGT